MTILKGLPENTLFWLVSIVDTYMQLYSLQGTFSILFLVFLSDRGITPKKLRNLVLEKERLSKILKIGTMKEPSAQREDQLKS